MKQSNVIIINIVLQVYNKLVCNCHEDSKLLGVIRLVERVYTARTEADREGFGKQLQDAIADFRDEFLHHMEEEEAVFQPLLKENFEPKELVDMNNMVLKQHSLFRAKVKREKSLSKATKRKREEDVFDNFDASFDSLRFRKSYCQEVNDFYTPPESAVIDQNENSKASTSSSSSCALSSSLATVHDLPGEVVAHILTFLDDPRDLLRSSAVCRSWNDLVTLTSALWPSLRPTQWARGVWTFKRVEPDSAAMAAILTSNSLASSTESLEEDTPLASDTPPSFSQTTSKEQRFYSGLIDHLLPKVGRFVGEMTLSCSKGMNDYHIGKMLSHCPNLVRLDLGYTDVGAAAFAGLASSGVTFERLEEVNSEGCRLLNDSALEALSGCFGLKGQKSKNKTSSRVKRLNLSGARAVTSYGMTFLTPYQASLEELDLSGVYKLDGDTLTIFVEGCPKLRPQSLSYCNDIEDGPYPKEANGCSNLECGGFKFCCQQLVN